MSSEKKLAIWKGWGKLPGRGKRYWQMARETGLETEEERFMR